MANMITSKTLRLFCTAVLAMGLSVPATALAVGGETTEGRNDSAFEESSLSTASAIDLRSQDEIENRVNSWRYEDGEEIGAFVDDGNAADAIAPIANGDGSVTPWTKTDKGFVNSKGEVVEGALYKGIDVSEWDGKIDWDKLKKESDIDFAIVRCGYGQDYTSQDDDYWARNVQECMRIGMPFGVYLYSYAGSDWRVKTRDENGNVLPYLKWRFNDEYRDWNDFYDTAVRKARGEARHVLRCLNDQGITPQTLSYPIYYDLEESSIQYAIEANEEGTNFRALLADMAKAFCNEIAQAGYTPGYYANLYWRTNFLTDPIFDTWDFWIAQYNSRCSYKGTYHLWQFGGTLVPGITSETGGERYADTNLDFKGPMTPPLVEETPPLPMVAHNDVNPESWFVKEGHYQYVLDHGLMEGENKTTFAPDAEISRSQLMTILWRMADKPSKYTNDPAYDFPDTSPDDFYTAAVRWGRAVGIIEGYGEEGKKVFLPDGPVTREEAAKMIASFNEVVLHRSIETSNTTMNTMPDASSVSNWAKPYMKWAVANKVINGSIENGTRNLKPQGTSTRAQAAAMIANFAQNVLGIK